MSENDVVGRVLGPFGKWQLRSTLLIYLVKIPSAWFMACLIFTAKSPTPGEIFCKPSYRVNVENATSWIQLAHRKIFNRVENEESYNFCLVSENATDKNSIYSGNDNHTFVECSDFEHRPIFYSIIHQYRLICWREAHVALSQSFHLLGVLIGGIIAFYLLKRISPRKVMLIGMVAQIFLGPMTGFAPVYELHLLFRCSAAATCSMMCIGIMIDITYGKYRVIAVCLFEQFWSIGVILLPGVSSWWTSWSTIYIAISIPTVGLIILTKWIPDSPRWLLKHERIDDALQVLKDAAKVNGTKIFSENELMKELSELSEFMHYDPPEPTLLSIWNVPFLIKLRLFVAHIGWSVFLMMYYASLLNVRAMGRNYLEVNTAIAGISEIVGTFFALYLILKTGRKWTYMSQFNIAISILAYSANYLPHDFPPFERMVIYMTVAMLFKIGISTSLGIFITSMSEIVSQDKKKMCNYSGVTCSRTLVIIAPFIGYFVIYGQLVPQTIMCVMNICISLVIAVFMKTPRTIPIESTHLLNEKQTAESFLRK